MPNVNVYNQDGSLAGEIALNDAVFGIEVNTSAIHQVAVGRRAPAVRDRVRPARRSGGMAALYLRRSPENMTRRSTRRSRRWQ